MIDWQITRYSSPALDLLYYIFSATDSQFRAEEYNNLLRIYHTSLTQIVEKLGGDSQKLFTFDDLQNQMKKFGKFALVMSPMFIMMTLADEKDLANMDDISQELGKKDEQLSMVKGYDAETQILYNERIQGLMRDVVKLGLYWD